MTRARDLIAFLKGERPRGLARLGAGTRLMRPYRIEGRRHVEIGAGVVIRAHAWLQAIEGWRDQRFRPRLVVEDGVYIGQYATIACIGEMIIGEGCVLSERVYVGDSLHGAAPGAPIMAQPLTSKGPIRIGKNCWLGVGVSVLPGVQLGDHVVVGAGAVVTKSFPPGVVLGGVPARIIRNAA